MEPSSDIAVFNINSAKRLSGTDSSFSYQFNLDQSIAYDRVVLLAANIAKSYYLVQAGYNTFTLIEGASTRTITVPAGNYTRSSFATCVSGILTSNSPNSFTYVISFPNTATGPETGLFTFTVSNNGVVQPSFQFSDNKICEQMGFNIFSTNQFSGNKLVSINTVNFSPETCLYLHSNLCFNTLTNDNILSEIYTNGIPYNSYISFINYNPSWTSKKLMKKGNIFSFDLTDENNNPINLNGVNMVLTIALYRTSMFKSFITKFLKYFISKDVIPEDGA